MDYEKFYAEVVEWIGQANQKAVQHGIGSSEFWQWVADSCARMCDKYENQRIVIKQMTMLTEWLEEAYEKSKG